MNVRWQHSAPYLDPNNPQETIRDVSAYVPQATAADYGVVLLTAPEEPEIEVNGIPVSDDFVVFVNQSFSVNSTQLWPEEAREEITMINLNDLVPAAPSRRHKRQMAAGRIRKHLGLSADRRTPAARRKRNRGLFRNGRHARQHSQRDGGLHASEALPKRRPPKSWHGQRFHLERRGHHARRQPPAEATSFVADYYK